MVQRDKFNFVLMGKRSVPLAPGEMKTLDED